MNYNISTPLFFIIVATSFNAYASLTTFDFLSSNYSDSITESNQKALSNSFRVLNEENKNKGIPHHEITLSECQTADECHTKDSMFEQLIRHFPEIVGNPVTPELLILDWPLDDKKQIVVDSFSSQNLSKITVELPDMPNNFEHTLFMGHFGMDITRSNPSLVSEKVYAPIAGKAILISSINSPNKNDFYRDSISIYDPKSNLVVNLLHIKAEKKFFGNKIIEVKKNELIGNLFHHPKRPDSERDRDLHTHVTVFNVEKKEYLNPVSFFPKYKDGVSPKIKDIYIIGPNGETLDRISEKPFDIIVDTYDLDDEYYRNQPITSIVFDVKSEEGELLLSSSCDFDYLNRTVFHSKNDPGLYVDVEKSKNDFVLYFSIPPNKLVTTQINPHRSFRYAINRLLNAGKGCHVSPTTKGLSIDDSINKIIVNIIAFDKFGNQSSMSRVFTR